MERRGARGHADRVRSADAGGEGGFEQLDLFPVDEVSARQHAVEGRQQLVVQATMDRGGVVEGNGAP